MSDASAYLRAAVVSLISAMRRRNLLASIVVFVIIALILASAFL